MDLPQVSENDFLEREGVNEVATVVNRARCIWRETLTRDVGIDGQIEHVANGRATGRIVGVQVKSGASYFGRESEKGVAFTPPEKHRNYWRAYPLPVVLVLHHPEEGRTIWTDAREQLEAGKTSITVPSDQLLDEAGVERALSLQGQLPESPVDPDQLISDMVEAWTGARDFDVTFFDLFCLGLTDLAFAVYFGMDLAWDIAEERVAESDTPTVGIGPDGYRFFDEYVTFLMAHDLARVDFDAWRQAAEEREMVASFIAPLTSRGRELVDRIREFDQALEVETTFPVIQETAVGLTYPSPVRRLSRVSLFGDAWRNRSDGTSVGRAVDG